MAIFLAQKWYGPMKWASGLPFLFLCIFQNFEGLLENLMGPWEKWMGPVILNASATAKLTPGPSCSKLTTLLVNDLLKFKSSDTQIC